jgi:membrane protein DedA with SNARE-associated domain
MGGRRLVQRLRLGGSFARVERLVGRYGGWMIIFGRYVAWLRPLVLFGVGSGGRRYRSIWLWELAGAALWSAFWLALGAAGGAAFEQTEQLADGQRIVLAITVGAALIAVWRFGARWRRFLPRFAVSR